MEDFSMATNETLVRRTAACRRTLSAAAAELTSRHRRGEQIDERDLASVGDQIASAFTLIGAWLREKREGERQSGLTNSRAAVRLANFAIATGRLLAAVDDMMGELAGGAIGGAIGGLPGAMLGADLGSQAEDFVAGPPPGGDSAGFAAQRLDAVFSAAEGGSSLDGRLKAITAQRHLERLAASDTGRALLEASGEKGRNFLQARRRRT
jgi:hypothetical protein